MKKTFKKLLLIIFVGVFAFSALNVSAAFTTEQTTQIGYEIEGFYVYIFNDEGMTKTQNADAGESIKFSEVAGPDMEVHPTEEVVEENGHSLVKVKLNINGGVQKLRETVEQVVNDKNQSEHFTGGKNNNYLVTFTVKYKLQLPEGSTAVYDSDYANVFSGDQLLLKDETNANNTIGLDQMIIAGVYNSETGSVDWSNGAKYAYDTNKGEHIFTSRSELMPYFDQYLIFTKDCEPGDQENSQESYTEEMATKSYNESYRFMMYETDTVNNPEQDDNEDDENQVTPAPTPNPDDNKQDDDNKLDPPIVDDNNNDEDQTTPTPDDNDKTDNTEDNKNNNNNDNDKLDPPTNDKTDNPTIEDRPTINDKNDEDNNNNNDNDQTVVTTNDDNNNNTPATKVNSTTSNKGQKVSVPNTASNSNVNITLFGILLLVSGSGIVMLTRKEM